MTEISQVISSTSPIQPATSSPAWNDGLLEPKSQAEGISADHLAKLIKSNVVGKDFVVVDVRRTDFEVNQF